MRKIAVYCRVGSKEQAIDKKPEINNGRLQPTQNTAENIKKF